MSKFLVYRDGRRYYPSHDTLEGALKEAGDQSHPKWKCNPYVKDADTGKVVFREGWDYFYNDFPDIALDEAGSALLDVQHSKTYAKRKNKILTLKQYVAELELLDER
jgi:hypothetical protein